MIDESKLNSLFDRFDAALQSSNYAATITGSPCDAWKASRPVVVELIDVLNTLAVLFPKAKLAAQALDAARGLLDSLCGTHAPALASTHTNEDPLLLKLQRALGAQASRPTAPTNPCDTWAGVRPVVLEAIGVLRGLGQEIPWLTRTADVLDTLRQLLDSLCGNAPSLTAQGVVLAAPTSILIWEDDPYLKAVGTSNPVLAQPILTLVPQNNQPLLKTQIDVADPPPQQYGSDTPQFRIWNAESALARGINFWGPILPSGTQWSTMAQPMQVHLDEGADFNAFYARDSGLNFFHGLVSKVVPPVTAYSGESPQVVCHELGHAILDAVKPELFDAMSTEIAAFHESFGDMSSILSALQLPTLRTYVLTETGGVLNTNSRLSQLARQLGWALRVQFSPNLADIDCLRNASNSFVYVDPSTLPSSAPASSLSAEPHSFSRVFTGAFLDALAGMFKVGPKLPSADGSANLAAVSVDAGTLLVEGIRLATVGPSFYSQVAAGMVQADMTLFGGRYAQALVGSFVKRGILDSASAVALVHDLKTPQGTHAFGVTGVLKGHRTMRFDGDSEGYKLTGPNVPALPLSPISTRFGVTLHVYLPAQANRFAVTAAAVTGGAALGKSPEAEAKAFVEDLIQLGRVSHGAANAVPVELFGAAVNGQDSRKTHVIVPDDGRLVLKRRHFDCGFACFK